jgi:hypothetical protein
LRFGLDLSRQIVGQPYGQSLHAENVLQRWQ